MKIIETEIQYNGVKLQLTIRMVIYHIIFINVVKHSNRRWKIKYYIIYVYVESINSDLCLI